MKTAPTSSSSSGKSSKYTITPATRASQRSSKFNSYVPQSQRPSQNAPAKSNLTTPGSITRWSAVTNTKTSPGNTRHWSPVSASGYSPTQYDIQVVEGEPEKKEKTSGCCWAALVFFILVATAGVLLMILWGCGVIWTSDPDNNSGGEDENEGGTHHKPQPWTPPTSVVKPKPRTEPYTPPADGIYEGDLEEYASDEILHYGYGKPAYSGLQFDGKDEPERLERYLDDVEKHKHEKVRKNKKTDEYVRSDDWSPQVGIWYCTKCGHPNKTSVDSCFRSAGRIVIGGREHIRYCSVRRPTSRQDIEAGNRKARQLWYKAHG